MPLNRGLLNFKQSYWVSHIKGMTGCLGRIAVEDGSILATLLPHNTVNVITPRRTI